MRRRRLFVLGLAMSGLAACAWPPRPTSLPAASNPAEGAAQTAGSVTDGLPAVAVPDVAVPAVQAPRLAPAPVTMPRLGGVSTVGRGGLLGR
jgi:hypothetical protein